ncbi:MAG: 4Fe-4S binding protein, partial [Thermodesulfobacteriota bacterium]|nr:4Fe-4S binding protein [Thermodesulfobacteriota bacterium]
IIQAGSAALNASRVIHASGGGLFAETGSEAEMRDVSQEPPRVLVAVCTCGGAVVRDLSTGELAASLKADPCVNQVIFIDSLCTQQGWDEMVEVAETTLPNRILIGACLPYVYARKLKELSRRIGLAPVLMDVVDLRTETFHRLDQAGSRTSIESNLKMGLARVRRADPLDAPTVPVAQRALVVGGGIAGLTAALSVAAHGFPVDLVECEDRLGGNLNWLTRTIEGDSPEKLLQETLVQVEKHPLIDAHIGTRVKTSSGRVGRFYTTLQDGTGAAGVMEHGVVILATGGTEAQTTSYCYGQSERIITQKELEERLADKSLDPGKLEMVVTILCVDSREEPRNFCSRVCCLSFLKNALYLKKENPDLGVCVLYRDIMSPGFYESYYTEARRAGVIFIPYDLDSKPKVNPQGETVAVTAGEPLVGRDVLIEADLLVLATGVSPNLAPDLAMAFGAEVDRDGFFQEAESKWRPVDSLKEGVFACGLAHSPRSITESIATAEAAAQRTLRILSRESLASGHIVAQVRHAFCSLCGLCIETCPYGARFLDQEQAMMLVNPAMCQGCGACAAICPNSASILVGYQDQQMFETIDAAIEGALDRPGEPAA